MANNVEHTHEDGTVHTHEGGDQLVEIATQMNLDSASHQRFHINDSADAILKKRIDAARETEGMKIREGDHPVWPAPEQAIQEWLNENGVKL
jgi:hypothetical protein